MQYGQVLCTSHQVHAGDVSGPYTPVNPSRERELTLEEAKHAW